MPLGAARAGMTAASAAGFVEFDLISAVTPTTDASNSLAVLASNANSWSSGDLLIGIASGAHASARTAATPSPVSWAPGSETWTSRYADTADVGGNLLLGNAWTATALSTEAAKTLTLGFSATMFNIVSALLRCPGSTIVRQVTPVAKVEGTGTSITPTFGAAVLETSQIVSIALQRNNGAFNPPTSFTGIYDSSPQSNLRCVVSARIGHSGTTVQTTGLSSSSLAKMAVAIELARPGQEL